MIKNHPVIARKFKAIYNKLMQVPKRKPGKYTFVKTDLNLTAAKFAELSAELSRLARIQPEAAAEAGRQAEMGDRSDNAGYAAAKARLRWLNDRIDELTNMLKRAVIIKPSAAGRVGLGSLVTVEIAGRQKTFQILGSQETNPGKGIISQSSPIGAALLGKAAGETAKIKLKNGEAECKIVKIK